MKVEGLVKTYRTSGVFFGKKRIVTAVNDVSFDLGPGRTLGIVGESGSGKSSLGRLLIKLMDSDGGRILFDGHDIAKLSEVVFRPLRPRIQMIFQDPFASLNPRSTIGQILTVGPVAHGTPYARPGRRRGRCCPMWDSMQVPSVAIRTNFPVGSASASV